MGCFILIAILMSVLGQVWSGAVSIPDLRRFLLCDCKCSLALPSSRCSVLVCSVWLWYFSDHTNSLSGEAQLNFLSFKALLEYWTFAFCLLSYWNFQKEKKKLLKELTRLNVCWKRGSYMIAHVLLNLFNELGRRDKIRGLPSILPQFLTRLINLIMQKYEC